MTNTVTLNNIPAKAHKRYAADQKGKVPPVLESDSLVWDDDLMFEQSEGGLTWIEWLFDIRPPTRIADFHKAEESGRTFVTSLIRGIKFGEVEEKLLNKMDEEIGEIEREKVLILLDLVKQAKSFDRDLKFARLANRPKQ